MPESRGSCPLPRLFDRKMAGRQKRQWRHAREAIDRPREPPIFASSEDGLAKALSR
jgi:hypothetical protein